jgi:hypothetical protein
MKKRLGLALIAGAIMTLLLFGVASAEQPPWGPPEGAAGPPVGGCKAAAQWRLVQPSGPDHLSAAYDFNRDGWVCVRFLPAFDGSSMFTFMDNVVRKI